VLRLLTFGGLGLESDGVSVTPRLRPPRLALLAVLAAAGNRGATRERLTALFWPDADEERGRHSLRQLLYALRNEAGEELVLAGPPLSLNQSLIGSDLAGFQAALEAGDRARAVALYRGPFLDGFYLPGATEFERWVEAERTRLAEANAAALLGLAQEASAGRNLPAALGWWHQLTLLDPLSGRYAVGYARALSAAGDRAGALAFIRTHESGVWRELEVEPDPDVRRLEADLRTPPELAPVSPQALVPGHPPAPEPAPPSLPASQPVPGPMGRRGRWPGRRSVVLAVVGVVLAVAVLGAREVLSSGAADALDPSLANATTTSRVAARFYQEGLRAYRVGDWVAARRFMDAALQEDSTFAMAAWLAAVMEGGDAYPLRRRAMRLAETAPEPERLAITADLLVTELDPSALAVAGEWAAGYPDEGRAFSVLGRARASSGDWSGAVEAYERAITLMLEAERRGTDYCLVCDELNRLADAYLWWDSLPAAERTARRSLDLHPEHGWAWSVLAMAGARAGDSAAALGNLRRYLASTPTRVDQGPELMARLTLEQYDQVEQQAQPLLASSRPEEVGLGRGMLMIALRNQGRLSDAADLLRRGTIRGSPPPSVPVDVDYVGEAVLALESGRPGRAASFFETRRRIEPRPSAPGVYARWVAWNTTLTATALAAIGDTAAVRRLADTVQYWGERSLFGRDRQAHHFLRGLLLAAEGRDEEAAREYREAIYSYTLGYTRVNYELAQCLLRLGRPAEAVAVLQPALRGAVDAANLYITRTALHQLLAEAFRRAGEPDSAAAHDQAVARAWGRADPGFVRRATAEVTGPPPRAIIESDSPPAAPPVRHR